MDGQPRSDREAIPARKTRIIATLGPASRDRRVVEELVASGLNVARINFAHGSPEEYAGAVKTVRDAARAVGRRVAIFGDLPGPKIRIGRIADEPVQLENGQQFVLQTDDIVGDANRASVSLATMADAVEPGDRVFINDGYLQLIVEEAAGGEVRCRVEIGGELRSNKGVNFPNANLGIDAFTVRDAELLRIAANLGLDGVSQSFVQTGSDIQAVREAAAKLGYQPFVIAKIERAQALDHLDEILAATDGIMVARGDLGVETPIERMALVQKRVIAAANRVGVPVITATHMLESMTEFSRPTRAEATDVANAILDGSDAVMLSGETAIGAHPIEAVRTLAAIAEEVERDGLPSRAPPRVEGRRWVDESDRRERLSTAAFGLMAGLEPTVVVMATQTGRSARAISRFRVAPWIVALTPEERTCQQMMFSAGVHPIRVEGLSSAFDQLCRSVLADLGIRHGIALLLLPEDVSGDAGAQHIHIVEL